MSYTAYHPEPSTYQYPPAPAYNFPLKPIPQTSTTSYSALPPAPLNHRDTALAAAADARTKQRIRTLKFLSRALATLLSLATFIPLAVTLVKFFQTKDETLVVDGEERTAWASGTITWYTYLYFAVATISLILNTAVLVGYCCGGVRGANTIGEVEGWWMYLQRGVELVGWVASVVIYRIGKEPDDFGKFKDLWGWTCAPAAQAIQDQITNIDYDTYCNVQTSSFYLGVLNTMAMILTGCIYLYAIIRMRSKKKLKEANAMEPLRH